MEEALHRHFAPRRALHVVEIFLRLLIAALVLASPLVGAASGPVTYDEAVQGDLPTYRNPPSLSPQFVLGVGVNTFTGSMATTAFGGDFDTISFAVPSGAKLTSVFITYRTSPVSTGSFDDMHYGMEFSYGTMPYFAYAGSQYAPSLVSYPSGEGCCGPGSATLKPLFSSALPLGPGNYTLDFSSLSYPKAGGLFSYTITFVVSSPLVSDILLRPPQIPTSVIPPALVGSPSQRNIVVVTHGWSPLGIATATSPWIETLVRNVCFKLGMIAQLDSSGIHPVWSCSNSSWLVTSADWSVQANVPLPLEAYIFAGSLGDELGDRIATLGANHVHFIAHSAGSNLIHHATERIRKRCADSGQAACQQTRIHETFLDAFAPLRTVESYGVGADYAEQFVDTLPVVFAGVLDPTNVMLPRTFNFDVTALDPHVIDSLGIDHHAWPYEFFNASVTPPFIAPVYLANGTTMPYRYGLPKSVELGGDIVTDRAAYPPLNCSCPITDSQTTVCELDAANSKTHCPPAQLLSVVVDALGTIASAFSPTGTVTTTGPIGQGASIPGVGLATGSPAWLGIQFQARQSVDVLEFDYAFTGSAQGLLSVYLDDKLLYRTQESHALPGSNTSGRLPFGIDPSAAHVLAFRLDPTNATPSQVQISNVRTSQLQLPPITNRPPVANAGPSQALECTSPSGTPVALDGSASLDLDHDALTYSWSGPFATLSGAKVTAQVPVGRSNVALTVNDQHGGVSSSSVSVTVSDTRAPAATAALVPTTKTEKKEGYFKVQFACADTCDSAPGSSALLNGVPVSNGQIVILELGKKVEATTVNGMLHLTAPDFALAIRCVDASGNVAMTSAVPIFAAK